MSLRNIVLMLALNILFSTQAFYVYDPSYYIGYGKSYKLNDKRLVSTDYNTLRVECAALQLKNCQKRRDYVQQSILTFRNNNASKVERLALRKKYAKRWQEMNKEMNQEELQCFEKSDNFEEQWDEIMFQAYLKYNNILDNRGVGGE